MRKGNTTALLALLLLLVGGCAGTKETTVERRDRLEMARAYSAETSGDALLVWIEGELVLEDYPNGYDPEKPHMLTEASMLFPSLAALVAAGDGRLRLEEPVSQTITEWEGDPRKAEITVSELLHLTAGFEAGSYRSVTVYEEAIAAPLAYEPGSAFRYGPVAYQVFGAVMERKSAESGWGGWMQSKLFEPLGIPGGRWLLADPSEASHLSAGTEAHPAPRLFDGSHLTPEQLGRVGLLLINGGRWNGTTLIQDVSVLTEPTTAGPGFGLGVWLNIGRESERGSNAAFFERVPEEIFLPDYDRLIYGGAPPDLYMAAGRYNQRLYVVPSADMAVVRLGRANVTWNDAEFLARLLHGQTLSERADQAEDSQDGE